MNLILLVVVHLACYCGVHSSQEVMKSMSINYLKALNTCKRELELPDSVYTDFINFWKEDYQLTNRLTGCAINCLSSKLDLVESEGRLHHGNAADYAKSHGADDSMVEQLVQLLQLCGGTITDDSDHCLNAMVFANCFKAEIHKLNWAPDSDLIIGELLAEV